MPAANRNGSSVLDTLLPNLIDNTLQLHMYNLKSLSVRNTSTKLPEHCPAQMMQKQSCSLLYDIALSFTEIS